MAKKEDYEQKTERLVEPLAKELSYELVDVEYIKEGTDYILRCYIDKEGGITIDDCERLSRQLSDALDREDFITDPYILEVSSPGLGRQLKKDKDFQRSIGKEVDVKLYKAMNKQKDYCGILQEFDAERVVICQEDETYVTFFRKEIALIRLTVHF